MPTAGDGFMVDGWSGGRCQQNSVVREIPYDEDLDLVVPAPSSCPVPIGQECKAERQLRRTKLDRPRPTMRGTVSGVSQSAPVVTQEATAPDRRLGDPAQSASDS